MIKFSTASGSWKIDSPTIEVYYKIQNWLAISDQPDAQVNLISLLSLAPEEEVREMKQDKFDHLWSQVSEGPLSAINTQSFSNKIEINKTIYGFVDLTALTIGELADLDTLKNHPQVSQQLHKMMAVLYRPLDANGVLTPHKTEGFEERAQLFLKNMQVSNVMAAIDFFFHITKVSFDSTMDSLMPAIQNLLTNLTPQETNEVTLKLQEAGINLSTFLPETTY